MNQVHQLNQLVVGSGRSGQIARLGSLFHPEGAYSGALRSELSQQTFQLVRRAQDEVHTGLLES